MVPVTWVVFKVSIPFIPVMLLPVVYPKTCFPHEVISDGAESFQVEHTVLSNPDPHGEKLLPFSIFGSREGERSGLGARLSLKTLQIFLISLLI